jgi:hypothetical protein
MAATIFPLKAIAVLALNGFILAGTLAATVFAVSKTKDVSNATVLHVGPRHALTSIAAAAAMAHDGDTVEIEAGDYIDGVATWTQNGLTLRAVGGRARISQRGASAEGKAIWVIKGDNVLVENLEFSGASVPDRNGAGIRHEGGRLTVRNCLFEQNQMGLLSWNDMRGELVIERSEFRDNRLTSTYRTSDDVGHQIYVGAIGRFTLRESYVHHGAFGHLVKSRARENRIVNNRITDEVGGRSSYELEFPNGGIAYVIGNIIGQSADTENQDLISFGAEGYRWPRNEFYLVSNTLVDDLPRGGKFVRVRDGADRVLVGNNLLLGKHFLQSGAMWTVIGNALAKPGDVPLAWRMDYRLRADSALVGAAANLAEANAESLRLEREYVHPMQSRALPAGPRSPGAIQSLVR